MTETNIHSQAIVEPGAKIGKGVTIEPFAVIKGTVTLCDGVTIKSHAYIEGHTTIGEGTTIYPSASIGTKTQDLKFRGEKTYVQIGKNCEIREFVTINASCEEGSIVKVGDNCLIMAYCHVAHNCEVGNHVIIANGSQLAGHVIIEDHVIIGGVTPIHQFSRIGRYSMVGGFSRITHDVPPYTLGAGAPYKLGGLNLVGLKRNNFTLEERRALSRAFKLTYRAGLHITEALAKIESELPLTPHIKHWIDFCRHSKRGLIGFYGATSESQDQLEDFEELLEDSISIPK